MLRHGERADRSIIEEERARISNPLDCPLTNLGVSQAHVTGQWLKEYFRRGFYKKVVIETSPLLTSL